MTTPELNFGDDQLSSMQLYSLQHQKLVGEFSEFDSVSKAYVDQMIAEAKAQLIGGASSALDSFS